MTLLNFIVPQVSEKADSVTKIPNVSEKLLALSDMSISQITTMVAENLIKVSFKILIALLIFFVGKWIIKYVKKLVVVIMDKREVDTSLRSFILSFMHITLMGLLVVTIVGFIGIDTTSFVALFASAGVAIGMALSGTLQNFAGGVLILVIRPYSVGDFIETQGYTGTVKSIQLFNTVINTPDNKSIMIPNGALSTGTINNYSRESTRRVDWTFGIAYGDNYDLAKNTIAEILKNDKRVLHEPVLPFIALHSLADSSVNIVVRAWVSTADYWDVYFDTNEKVYKRFAEVGINIPFPQLDVHIKEHNQTNHIKL